MDLAMQIMSNDKTVRSNTVQYLKDFNSQSLATQVKKRVQLVSMMPAPKKAFDLLCDEIVQLSKENESLKNKIGSYDEKKLEGSKAKLLKQIDGKRANLIMSRMEKHMKERNKWLLYHATNYGEATFILTSRRKIECENYFLTN